MTTDGTPKKEDGKSSFLEKNVSPHPIRNGSVKSNHLHFLRLIFVIASFTPLIILWGVRGAKDISEITLWSWVVALTVVPNAVIFMRWRLVRRENITVQVEVIDATDQREHLVIYLLAVLLAMYGFSIGSVREAIALVLALSLVVVLFWFANLHYLNLIFAVMGYRTFTVTQRVNDGSSRKSSKVVILSKRDCIEMGESLICYRLSHDLFVEREE